MKSDLFKYKTRLLFIAGALFVICAGSSPVQAQTANETTQLLSRINELENQVQTLSRAVYRGDKNAQAAVATQASGADAAAAANNEERMSAIEDAQRKLTGQLEKITFDLQQIKDRADHMQADTDQRFQQLEHGPAASTTVAPPPVSASAAPAPGTLGTLSSGSASEGSSGPAETLYEEAFADVRDSKYEEGEAKFKQFLSQYPGHPLSANAEYWLGETYYVRGDYKQAAKTFAQGYQSYPKSGKAEDSLFKLALSLGKMDKRDDACLSLRQMQKDFAGDTGPLHLKAQAEIKQLNCP